MGSPKLVSAVRSVSERKVTVATPFTLVKATTSLSRVWPALSKISTIPWACVVNERPVRVAIRGRSGVFSGMVQLTALPFNERVTVEHEWAQLRLDIRRKTTGIAAKVSGCSNLDAGRKTGGGTVGT